MTLEQAIDYINDFTWSTSRLGLERTEELLRRLGNPEKHLKFIHVAGTNGKGSTCAMTERILREAGYRTGFYPSPYIEDFRERIQVNGEYISKEALARITEQVAMQADAMEDHPSQFELITAIGMLYFAELHCDYVVLEVGMGGALDSTNVIDPPEVAVITNIGLDHTEFLGDTIEKIAATKCGIIKPGSAVVSYANVPSVMEVIRKAAADAGDRLYESPQIMHVRDCSEESKTSKDGAAPENASASGSNITGVSMKAEAVHAGDGKNVILALDHDLHGQRFSYKGREYNLRLLGEHQLRNAATVLAIVEALRDRGVKITEEAVAAGFANVEWPARFEVLRHEPLFILDGGHNPQCAEALIENIEAYILSAGEDPMEKLIRSMEVWDDDESKEQKGEHDEPGFRDPDPEEKDPDKRCVTFLIGMLADKDYHRTLELLSPYGANYVCITPESPRALPASELAETIRGMHKEENLVIESFGDDITKAIVRALDLGLPVIAFGSLYSAGTIRGGFKKAFKKWQRKGATAARRALSEEERAKKSHQICERLQEYVEELQKEKPVRTIFSYAASWDEANVDEFNDWALKQGIKVVFPLCRKGGIMDAMAPLEGVKPEDWFASGAYGIREPKEDLSRIADPKEIDVCVVPCVGFDHNSGRIGHGAGFYDRYLPKLRDDAKMMLVAFDAQYLPDICMEETDTLIDNYITESVSKYL